MNKLSKGLKSAGDWFSTHWQNGCAYIKTNPDGFNAIAGGIQSIVISIGVIVSGIGAAILLWPQYVHALVEEEQYEADHQPVLNITVTSDLEYIPELGHKGIVAVTTIGNPGIREVDLDYRKYPPLRIGKYNKDTKKFDMYCTGSIWLAGESKQETKYSFQAHEQSVSRFVTGVDKPGTYLIEFMAYTPDNKDPSNQEWFYVSTSLLIIDQNDAGMKQVTAVNLNGTEIQTPASPPPPC